MEDTIFGQIVRGEAPAYKVYEDKDTLAFLNIHPDSVGHTLVIPKVAARNIFDVDADTFTKVMQTVHDLAPKLRDALGASGMRIVINNEAEAGQVVFHIHVHLIPFYKNHAAEIPDGESLEEVATRITASLT